MSATDTSTWLPLDGLAPGFDANKAPTTDALAGRTITVQGPDGAVEHVFDRDEVAWRHLDGDTASGRDAYEAFEVDDGLLYVQMHLSSPPTRAISMLLDLRAGRSLTVVADIAEPERGRTRVRQDFAPGTIDGVEPTGTAPAPTTTLIGRRVVWDYSPEHAYEHVYLSPQWYSWQCLAGPERGLADTDENSVWQVRPGIYVFTWREKVIPCASVTVADHRDVNAIRSHGVLFGLDESGEVPTHFTFGAHGRLLSTTVHPDHLDPAAIG